MKAYYNDSGLFTMPLPRFWPAEGVGWHPNATWVLRIIEFSDRLWGCGKAYHFVKRHVEYLKGKTTRYGYKGPIYAAYRVDNGERVSCTYLWGEPDYCLGCTPRWCGPYDVYNYCLHEIPANFITPTLQLDT